MKANSTFVRPDGRVKLHPVTPIDLNVTFIVEPWHAKHDDTLWFYHALENLVLFVFGMIYDEGNNGFYYLLYCLEKLGFVAVFSPNLFHKRFNGCMIFYFGFHRCFVMNFWGKCR